MLNKISYIGLISSAALSLSLAAQPVFAQSAEEPFVKAQTLNQWRASKLVGVSVIGPNQEKVGKVADVMLDHDGNAEVVVVSVGGFLGIGAKDVGVPFKTMQWRTEGRTVAVGPAAADPAKGDMTAKTDPAATEASQGYPDMGVLNMTKAQLQSAPDFKYAPSPVADAAATATPAGSVAPAPAAQPPAKTNQ